MRRATVAAFARNLDPSRATLREWLAWPPDLFALTSLLLRQTGCYKYVVAEHWVDQRQSTWQRDIDDSAEEWIAAVDANIMACSKGKAETPFVPAMAPFSAAIGYVETNAASMTLDELRALTAEKSCAFARELITLHAIADSACAGLGLIGQGPPDGAMYWCVANLLLTAYGSLSSLGKHHGVVLPKLRTPQSGMTLRSLSHNVTFHTSEVEVMWRTVPWANIPENSLNMLLVPWPDTVTEQSFSERRDTFSSVRYFSYDPSGGSRADWDERLDTLVDEVVRINREIGRLHLIVLPELALPYDEYRRLLFRLRSARTRVKDRLRHVPMVIAGVKRDLENESPNQVHLAAFFSDRWYDLSQRKHHRWKLDRNQVRQYQLEARLATARAWYESTPMSQRRLSFLAPNGWLTLCPLICEDLAQLEPVSEFIRGVGPTLLTALLMDGPQLKDRWSARYASVFADDPGTAVLTLTSAGMVRRSRQLDSPNAPPPERAAIGLWKDRPSGWKNLDVPVGQAALLSLSSTWETQFTADGRSDGEMSSTFRFEGVRDIELSAKRRKASPQAERFNRERLGPDEGDEYFGDWADLRELTAATFMTNGLIRLRGQSTSTLVRWLRAERPSRPAKGPMGELVRFIVGAFHNPDQVGVKAEGRDRKVKWPTRELFVATQVLERWFSPRKPTKKLQTPYYERLVRQAISTLRRMKRDRLSGMRHVHARVERSVALTVLNAVHSNVESNRRLAFRPEMMLGHEDRPTSFVDPQAASAKLLEMIEAALEKYS